MRPVLEMTRGVEVRGRLLLCSDAAAAACPTPKPLQPPSPPAETILCTRTKFTRESYEQIGRKSTRVGDGRDGAPAARAQREQHSTAHSTHAKAASKAARGRWAGIGLVVAAGRPACKESCEEGLRGSRPLWVHAGRGGSSKESFARGDRRNGGRRKALCACQSIQRPGMKNG